MEAEEKPKHTWNKVNHWAAELEILQTIISKTNLVETIKWGAPVYTLNGKNIVGITGFKNHFALAILFKMHPVRNLSSTSFKLFSKIHLYKLVCCPLNKG